MKTQLFLTCIAASLLCVLSVPNRPPAIFLQPPFDVYYKVGETVQMQCKAEGVPAPTYTWTRNKESFDPSGNGDRMVMLPNEGTIVMNRPEDKDEGIFQCSAKNDHGISTSININLREAMLEDFQFGEPKQVYVERGNSQKLECIPPTSIPKAEIKWVLKDRNSGRIEAINFDQRITMDLEGNLYLTHVTAADEEDGKLYVCMATNYFMRKNTYDRGYLLSPYGSSGTDSNRDPHYLWTSPNEVFGLLGETIRIKCIYGGNPTPEIHWESTTPGQIPDNRRILSLGGQELLITQLTIEDKGSYTCYAISPSGNRLQTEIKILVKSKPYWTEDGEPMDIEKGVGETATFFCNATGDPSPDLKWFVNGVPLEDSTHPTVKSDRFLKPNRNNVTIVNLQKSDAMVLQCNASNIYGYVFGDFYLNVLKERPQFIKRPIKELKVAETTDVYLTCQTSGKPDPIITWFKGTQQITGGRYQIMPNGDLHISNIVLSDAGNFTCLAENSEGFDKDWGVLIVRRKTRIEQSPSDLENTAGTDAKFTCSGTTDFEEVANLQVLWLKDGKEITTNDQRMTTNVQDNSLTISGTISRDSGLYTCVVTNGLDSETASAILTVKDVPDPPVNVEKKDCINRKVTLTWTKGAFNNAPIQYFTVQFNTSLEPDNWVFAATVQQSLNTITLNLKPGVDYSFRLLATNKIGLSEPSKHSDICTTVTDKPVKNPDNVRGLGDKPNYLVIEWTPMPPIEQGGKNFHYVLSISRRGNTVQDFTRTLSDWRTKRYEYLTNDIYTPYNVTIKASNEHGDSAAELKTYTLYSGESKPDAKIFVETFIVDTASLEDNAATFYWNWDMGLNDATNSGLNGRFRGFKLQYWVRHKRDVTFRENEILEKDLTPRYGSLTRKRRSVTEFKYRLTELLPYTYMEAQICVMTTHYVSKPSPIAAFVTDRGVPGPVENLRALVIGSNFVELTWSAPELLDPPNTDTNVYLHGYDVGYQTVDGLDLGKMQERDPQIVDPRLNTTVLNGLTANQKYRIHMWGRTENGRGEVSFLELTTAKTASMSVPGFSIINVNSTFFNVTWTTIANKRFGTVVFVEYRKEGVSDWQQTPQEVSKSWIGVSNLETGTSYEVRLSVTNGDSSSTSEVEIVSTKGMPAAYGLGANFGWFIGLIISVLLIIAIAILIYLMYKRRPEPHKQKPYTAPPRRQDGYADDRSTQDIVHKSSDSLNRGYDNYNYSDREYRDDHDDYHRDDYDRRGYDDRYDDYDKRHYDDGDYDRRHDDDYDRRYDDDYDRRLDDDYDRRHDDDYDRRYDDDYDRYDDKKRHSDYEDKKRYDDDHNDYEPYARRPEYDRTPSYDYRPPSYGDVDLKEPAKFDADGYPIDEPRVDVVPPSTPGSSSMV